MAAGKEEKRKGRRGPQRPQVAPHGRDVAPVRAPRGRSPASRKARKQRRRLHQAPLHRRGKLLQAHLSSRYLEDPKVRYPRSLPVREGDTVRVLRGDQKGHEGKVTEVDRRGLRVFVDGVTVAKADGTEVKRPVHPSNLLITKLNLDDPRRRRLIERAGGRP